MANENNTNKKTSQLILLIVVVVIACAGLIWFIARGNSGGTTDNSDNATSGTLSLYYSETCTHCKNVEKFMQENNIAEKLGVESKEVTTNIKNNNELMTRAANCGYDLTAVGVPMLYDGGTCYSGDEEIINFFKSKLGL